jgi:adenosylhomocysteine nucleosidase
MILKKAGIIASIPEEIEVFKEIIKDEKWDNTEVFSEYSGVGKVSTALVTQKMIYEKNPDIVIYVGTVGSLSDDLKIGDIIIITKAIDAEFDLRGYEPTLERGEDPFTHKRVYYSDEKLSKIALKAPLSFKIIEGYSATISFFMNEIKKEEFIKNNLSELAFKKDNQIIFPNVIDMESCAFINACENHNKPCIIIKTISNNVDSDTSEEYELFRKNGIKNYMSVVAYILNTLRKELNKD